MDLLQNLTGRSRTAPLSKNELVGGLITYLSDPDLVPPAETLTVYLKTLQEMDVQQMANYLGLDSILNTSDSAKMPLLLPYGTVSLLF